MSFLPIEQQERVDVQEPEDRAYGRRDQAATRIANHARIGQLTSSTTGLEHTAAGGQDVSDPLGARAVVERDGVAARSPKHADRRSIAAPARPPAVLDDVDAGQPTGERPSDPVGDSPVEMGDGHWQRHDLDSLVSLVS